MKDSGSGETGARPTASEQPRTATSADAVSTDSPLECFAHTRRGISGGSPLIGMARMRDVVSRVAAGDSVEDVATDFRLTTRQVDLALDAAHMDWVRSSFREAIVLLHNAAFAELDGVEPRIDF